MIVLSIAVFDGVAAGDVDDGMGVDIDEEDEVVEPVFSDELPQADIPKARTEATAKQQTFALMGSVTPDRPFL
ncbi:hypothetical protein ACFUC1_01525 [Pedococcus sp. NPDC057267]|uniref:hypothetical protein n=1 Tax=Pedococcus sp. NPDC057267 TaxID=3346077 RepID=UPI003630BC9A